MDDFGVKYFSKDDANHLLNSIKKHYTISIDWEGRNYLGLMIDCNYSDEYIHISMPDYVSKAMDWLQYPKPKRPQYAPYRWSVPAYGKRLYMALDKDKRDLLDKKATKIIQSIVGNMLDYSKSVNPTMLQAINENFLVQSRPIWDTEGKARILLDYAATYPNAILCYKDSNMELHMDSDAAYLTIPEARSCYEGNFYLSDWPSPSPIKANPERNGPIHTECQKICNVVSSADEAETCGTLNNGKTAIGMRPALIVLNHKKTATTLKTDNSITKGFVNLGMKPKRSKNVGYEVALVQIQIFH